MRKYFFLSAIFIFIATAAPQATSAQWTNPFEYYRRNEIIVNGTKKAPARKNAAKRKKSMTPRKAAKKGVRRKTRRASALDGAINPKLKLAEHISPQTLIV